MSRITRAPQAVFGWKDLEPLQTVLDDTRRRSEGRQNIPMGSVLDMNLQFADPNPRQPRGGFVAKIDGKTLPLGDGAIKTACKLMGAKPEMFRKASDPMAFAEMLRSIVDNPNRKQQGVLLRTGLAPNGIDEEIQAILNPDYRIRDAHEQLEHFAGVLEDNGMNVRGVSRLEQGFGQANSYRMIVGENVMPSLDDLRGQFMMFVYSGSETGLVSDMTTLGLYRLICTNGAMRMDHHQLVSEWNHRQPLDRHLNKASESIRHMGYLTETWGKTFQQLANEPLEQPAPDLLHALRDQSLISSGHYDAAERISVTEQVDTQFDFYNLLTRSAQDLPSISQREKAESTALRLFTEPGGVIEQLRRSASGRRSANAPLLPADGDDGGAAE